MPLVMSREEDGESRMRTDSIASVAFAKYFSHVLFRILLFSLDILFMSKELEKIEYPRLAPIHDSEAG